jgi:hypothetical protein
MKAMDMKNIEAEGNKSLPGYTNKCRICTLMDRRGTGDKC